MAFLVGIALFSSSSSQPEARADLRTGAVLLWGASVLAFFVDYLILLSTIGGATMPTWEETKKYIHERFKIAVEEPSWLGLTWSFPDGANQELQRQRIELGQAFGQPHLLIMCDVVPEEALSPREALRHVTSLAVVGPRSSLSYGL